MDKIFENAKFGDCFKTRDGRKFVYLGEVKSLFGHNSSIQGMIEDDDILTYYNSEGKSLYCEYNGSAINAFDIDFSQLNCDEDCETDIVSEWTIDEEELDKLAWEKYPDDDDDDTPLYGIDRTEQREAYKAGFRTKEK